VIQPFRVVFDTVARASSCPVCCQLYRVNVLLQSPDSLDLSTKPPFFVLRRYSQFRQLHAEVRCFLHAHR
jgi:hypothetical protein